MDQAKTTAGCLCPSYFHTVWPDGDRAEGDPTLSRTRFLISDLIPGMTKINGTKR